MIGYWLYCEFKIFFSFSPQNYSFPPPSSTQAQHVLTLLSLFPQRLSNGKLWNPEALANVCAEQDRYSSLLLVCRRTFLVKWRVRRMLLRFFRVC